MKKSYGSIIVMATLILSGCATPKPVQPTVLNLDVVKSSGATKTIDKTIIVLNPSLKILNSKNADRMDVRSQIVRMQQGIYGGDYNFNELYKKKYSSLSSNALRDDIADILLNQGFEVNSDYQTYDDIDFSVKKKAYLVIEPFIEISFMNNGVEKDTTGSTLTETGTVNIAGFVGIKNLEPLSREQLSLKKVNLSDLSLQKSYKSVREIKSTNSYVSPYGAGKALGGALGNAMWGSSESDDTTQSVMVSFLNNIQSFSIEKFKSRLQKENILAYENDINEIKQKKRY